MTRIKLWKSFHSIPSLNADGSYVAHIPGTNVAVVAVNTLIWYAGNSLAKEAMAEDPGNQFQWLEETLQTLKNIPHRKVNCTEIAACSMQHVVVLVISFGLRRKYWRSGGKNTTEWESKTQ